MTNVGSNEDPSSGPVRIYIATTAGPVHIQRITREDPDVSSVVCLGGKAVALPISGAYDAFVRDPTGVIQRRFGHGAYRIDVAATVDDGYSWQLAVYLAHAAEVTCGLAADDEATAPAYIVTGEVDRDLNVLTVDHVAAKLAQIPADDPRFVSASVIFPAANKGDAGQEGGHRFNSVATVDEAFSILGLQVPSRAQNDGSPEPGSAAGQFFEDPLTSPFLMPAAEPPKRHGWRWALAVVLLLTAGTGMAAYSGPVPAWIELYERGRAADLHRDLRQSEDPRARLAETLLRALRPNVDRLVLRVDGSGQGLTFQAQAPDGIYLSGRGMRWAGNMDNLSRPDHVVYLDPRPGNLSWQPEADAAKPKADGATKKKASPETVYRLVVLASPRPISGPQPWFPALGGLGLPGRAGQRAAQVQARLNNVGITVKALEHRARHQ